MPNGHGGKRNGSGRKPDPTKVRLTPPVLATNGAVLTPDNDPVDGLMRGARMFLELAAKYAPGTESADEDMRAKYTRDALDAFAKAAPYLRHRLATVTHVGNDGAIKIEAVNIALANMNQKDLTAFVDLLSPIAAASRVTPAIAGGSAEEAPRTIEG